MNKSDQATVDYLSNQLTIEKQRLSACQENLSMHKELLKSLMTGDQDPLQEIEKKDKIIEEKDHEIDRLNAEILVYQKLINDIEKDHKEREKELTERVEEIKVKLERTENMFQNKEKKWGELERIVVNYARKDLDLRNKLSEIKYICDDPSSKRRITTVVEENARLKTELEEIKSEMGDLRSHIEYAKSNPTCLYDEDDDYFKLTMQFQEDEVRMDKKLLTKKSHNTAMNTSGISDNRSNLGNLNVAFIDKSRIDTSNMIMDDGSILGGLQLNKSNTHPQWNISANSFNPTSTNEWSKWKWLIFENKKKEELIRKYIGEQEYEKEKKEMHKEFDSFGVEQGHEDEFKLKINEDLILSGNHIANPNTFELKQELFHLEDSIGKIQHNRTMSGIKYPVNHRRMESAIKMKDLLS